MIANKIKKIHLKIISPFQSTFVLNRLINDDIVMVYEVVHTLKQYKKEKHGLVALKLDMEKAYDRI